MKKCILSFALLLIISHLSTFAEADIWQITQTNAQTSTFDGHRAVPTEIKNNELFYLVNSSKGETIVAKKVKNTGTIQPLWDGLADIRQMPALINEEHGMPHSGFCGYYAIFNTARLAKGETDYITNRETFSYEFFNMLQQIDQIRHKAPYDSLSTIEMGKLLEKQQLDDDIRIVILGVASDKSIIEYSPHTEDKVRVDAFKSGRINELIVILAADNHGTTIHVERPYNWKPDYYRFSVYDSLSDDWYDPETIQRKIEPLYRYLL